MSLADGRNLLRHLPNEFIKEIKVRSSEPKAIQETRVCSDLV